MGVSTLEPGVAPPCREAIVAIGAAMNGIASRSSEMEPARRGCSSENSCGLSSPWVVATARRTKKYRAGARCNGSAAAMRRLLCESRLTKWCCKQPDAIDYSRIRKGLRVFYYWRFVLSLIQFNWLFCGSPDPVPDMCGIMPARGPCAPISTRCLRALHGASPQRQHEDERTYRQQAHEPSPRTKAQGAT